MVVSGDKQNKENNLLRYLDSHDSSFCIEDDR